MSKRYLVKVRQITDFPVVVEASSEQEASEKVGKRIGDPGQYSPDELEIISGTVMDD